MDPAKKTLSTTTGIYQIPGYSGFVPGVMSENLYAGTYAAITSQADEIRERKVESAVRMVHVPSGLTVRCEQERSQGRNKELALQLLKAKLLVAQRQQRVAELAEIKGDLVKAEWGQQIRSYVLAPYKMVKDLRTACETSQVDAVLDGGLAELIDAYLQHAARERKADAVDG